MFSQTKPTLATTKVWSSTDMHTMEPSAATWATSVVTFTEKNHGLTTGDSVSITCGNTSLGWNMGTKTVTVVDNNTFTVPLVSDPGTFPNTNPYPNDTAGYNTARVTVKCSKYSKTFYAATYLQIENLGGAASMKLQAKLHDDAPWVDTTQTTLAVGITKVTDPHNFMRLVGATVPSSSVSVYTQK